MDNKVVLPGGDAEIPIPIKPFSHLSFSARLFFFAIGHKVYKSRAIGIEFAYFISN
jgi:hypothetical protein